MTSKIPSKDLFLTGGILDYSKFEGKNDIKSFNNV
uniref:Uncharacterized protein n=1 Tax=Myoviridae sp. ctIty1 TaxID=2827673 RepID=A0A8S5TGK0_9CAUD|nr:MAG TPA: hypothetical protein [Myoviridae sp. ctIty1]